MTDRSGLPAPGCFPIHTRIELTRPERPDVDQGMDTPEPHADRALSLTDYVNEPGISTEERNRRKHFVFALRYGVGAHQPPMAADVTGDPKVLANALAIAPGIYGIQRAAPGEPGSIIWPRLSTRPPRLQYLPGYEPWLRPDRPFRGYRPGIVAKRSTLDRWTRRWWRLDTAFDRVRFRIEYALEQRR